MNVRFVNPCKVKFRSKHSELRSFPSIALCIPTAHNFAHDYCAHSEMAAFSLHLDLAKEVNCHFLENDYSDLSFFLLF